MDNFLSHILTLIGFDRGEIELGTRFRNSRVEIYYTIKRDKEIECFGKKLSFFRGDQIIVAVSYKYEVRNFRRFLDMYFYPVDIFTSKDNAYCLALCKK